MLHAQSLSPPCFYIVLFKLNPSQRMNPSFPPKEWSQTIIAAPVLIDLSL